MIRSCFAVFGLCAALAACGQVFSADSTPSGGAGGEAGAGEQSAGGASGGTEQGGSASGGKASGGSAGRSNTAGTNAGGAANVGGSGGVQGLSGSGGASPESPIPVSGLALWLRADRGVLQKDGLVQQWLDQSGNQMDATQISANVRPKYLATGFDGKPTLEFDGQGQFLKFAEGFDNLSHGLAMFIVAKPTNSDCASMVELSNGSEIEDIAFGMWQNKWTYEVAANFVQNGAVDSSNFSLYAVDHRTLGNLDLRNDGNLLANTSFDVPTGSVRANNFIGHTLYADCGYFQGQISEIILYSRPVADKELLNIEAYLSQHWSLASTATP